MGRRRVAQLGLELHEAPGQLRLGNLGLGPRSDSIVEAPGGLDGRRAGAGERLAIGFRPGHRRACELDGGLGVAPDGFERGAGRSRARHSDSPPPRREAVALDRHDRAGRPLLSEAKRFDEPAPTEQDAGEKPVKHGADA